MSVVVEFFTAPDDRTAARALRTGPEPASASLRAGNFDVEEAVVEWECLLAGGDFADLVAAGEPRAIAEDDTGCLVFALSPRLCAALAGAEAPRLRDLARSWVARRAEDGEVIAAEIAHGIVTALAALADASQRRRTGVYCRVA
ncbi:MULTISPECIES: hypothetical protein [unclassified Streptomyces]|uniref:hypothetical protein n=1 Tax=unclassified Streptomyces TaxID=2593676 RepID=UPI0036EC1E91